MRRMSRAKLSGYNSPKRTNGFRCRSIHPTLAGTSSPALGLGISESAWPLVRTSTPGALILNVAAPIAPKAMTIKAAPRTRDIASFSAGADTTTSDATMNRGHAAPISGRPVFSFSRMRRLSSATASLPLEPPLHPHREHPLATPFVITQRLMKRNRSLPRRYPSASHLQ